MNLKKIREILDSPANEDQQKSLIIQELSKDENLIPTLLLILESERKQKSQLVENMNLLLSKAEVGLKEPEINKDGFMQNEIAEFYRTSEMNHCFEN